MKIFVKGAILFLTLMLIIPSVVSADADDDVDIIVGAMGPPTNFACALPGNSRVNLTWDKPVEADTVLIIRKQDSYPTSKTDGTEIYNGSITNYTDEAVTIGNHYYYRAWSYNITFNEYSVDYDSDHILVLEPALFDIKDIIILDSIIPTLSIVCTVENTGGIATDITVTWVLTRVDSGVTLDTGSDTFAVTGGSERLYLITPSTAYIGHCRITFSGDDASAFKLFYTEEALEAGVPGAGGGGGGRPPSARDSDGDGLTNAEEEFYGTDPDRADTDGDGFSDYEEIMAGTDPLDPTSHPVAVAEYFAYFMIGVAISGFVLILIWFFIYKKKENEKNQRKRKATRTQR